ncbi:MAG TPA: hypothetical protein VFV01_20015 [Spirillospora sp.]|nr:hypothetical protein [Spirillospora sp.]
MSLVDLPALPPEGPGEIDPMAVKLAVTVMHITVFFCLMGRGLTPEHALSLTVGVGLGCATVIDRFLNGRGGPEER